MLWLKVRAPMFESILVPLDGSQWAEGALAPVEEIAQRSGSHVHLFHAITPLDHLIGDHLPFAGVSSQSQDLRELLMGQQIEHEAAARVYLNGIRERLVTRGIKCDVHLESAEASDAILRYTHDAKISAIIMTSRGRGSREFRLYGNVAGEVLRRSTVPVVLVHPVASAGQSRR
jgi:nucleotide-binding universal stress UspA family protein